MKYNIISYNTITISTVAETQKMKATKPLDYVKWSYLKANVS